MFCVMMLPEAESVKMAPSPATLEAMIKGIADGNMTALHDLYDAVSGAVYGFALSITRSAHDAEDVLQETFLTVHGGAASYTAHGKPMAWILRIARNHALMHLRRMKRYAPNGDDSPYNSEALSRVDDAEERILLKGLLESLTEQERQIVMLRAVVGMRSREIAELLHLPLGTVLSKYSRSIKKLQELCEEK